MYMIQGVRYTDCTGGDVQVTCGNCEPQSHLYSGQVGVVVELTAGQCPQLISSLSDT